MENNSVQAIHETLYKHLRENHKDLRFKSRQTNLYGRLDIGYWFIGNENYLGLSFWGGTDWQNKTPNIFVGIDLKNIDFPSIFIEFVAYTDEKKADFFKKIATPLRLTRAKRSGKDTNLWRKTIEGTYLEALDQFIETDKPIIDAFITSQKIENLFPSIEENDFNRKVADIERRRKQRILQSKFTPLTNNGTAKNPLFLKRLILQNIAEFKRIDIAFNKQVTCFIGQNGSGKTTILRSLLLGLIGIDQNPIIRQDEHLANSLINLLRIKGHNRNEMIYEEHGSIALTTNQQTEPTGVNYSFDEQKMPQPHDEGNFEYQIDESGNLKTLIIGFSQIQGARTGKIQNSDSPKPNVDDVLPLLANEPDGRGEVLSEWLIQLDHAAANKEKNSESSTERQLINRMFEIISAVTEQAIHFLSVNPRKKLIWISINNQAVPLNLVSQGFSNVFSWVGFFMKRLERTAPIGTTDPTQLPAICLIDEIDTYLHPLWQRTILPVLTQYFPKTQFFITTHSPLVVSNLENANIYKIQKGAVTAINGYFGKDYSFTLESEMETPSRNESVQKELDTLFEFIDNEKFDMAQTSLITLNKKYPYEPELTRAQTMITLLTEQD
jgi:predicted ATP-binding protein involved in virulence